MGGDPELCQGPLLPRLRLPLWFFPEKRASGVAERLCVQREVQDGLSQDFKRGQLAWVSLGGLASPGPPGAFGLGAVQNPRSGEINTPA